MSFAEFEVAYYWVTRLCLECGTRAVPDRTN